MLSNTRHCNGGQSCAYVIVPTMYFFVRYTIRRTPEHSPHRVCLNNTLYVDQTTVSRLPLWMILATGPSWHHTPTVAARPHISLVTCRLLGLCKRTGDTPVSKPNSQRRRELCSGTSRLRAPGQLHSVVTRRTVQVDNLAVEPVAIANLGLHTREVDRL